MNYKYFIEEYLKEQNEGLQTENKELLEKLKKGDFDCDISNFVRNLSCLIDDEDYKENYAIQRIVNDYIDKCLDIGYYESIERNKI